MIIIIKAHLVDNLETSRGQIRLKTFTHNQREKLGFDYYVADNWHKYLVSLVQFKHIRMLQVLAKALNYKLVFEVYEFGKVPGDKSPYRNLYPQVFAENGDLLTKRYGNLTDYVRRKG